MVLRGLSFAYARGITLRALITGIGGFAGSHLAEYLLMQGDVVVSGVISPRRHTHNIAHLLPRISIYALDLQQYDAVRSLLQETRPELIFHLAAQASVQRAWQDPAYTIINNVRCQLNILQAMIELQLSPRVLIVGSADEYGRVQPDELPVDEDTPLRPLNPYAVSKVTQDYLGYQYYLSHGLEIVRVRPFNHIGPRQDTGFVVPDFCRQIARIEAGLQESVMYVGNLSAERDFSDVRDIVRGYYLALTRGFPGEVYNLGSSRAVSIASVLELLLEISEANIQVGQDPKRMRPSDIPTIVSDCQRVCRDTGWYPEIPLKRSLCDTLDYWRDRVRQEAQSGV